MIRSSYPLSLRIVIILAIIVIVLVVLFVLPSNGTQRPRIILPDGQLPWNSDHTKVVEVLNEIYQHDGKKTEWSMCDTGVEGLWQMCLKDKDAAGPFRFNFVDDKLVGYFAEFQLSDYDNLVYSGKHIYGASHGVVKSASREFRIYEMGIRRGWLELYMVLDRDTKKIRVQAKYKHIGSKDKTQTLESDTEDDKAWEHTESNMASATLTGQTGKESLNCLTIQTLEPLSSKSTKRLEVQFRLPTRLALVQVLFGTSYGHFGIKR